MEKFRVRFAPSPTGMMHLGNVRAALLNFLFARQKKGTYILRIEDTDQERMHDPKAEKIIEDLHWLGLVYDEGPNVGGPHEPYFQSQRAHLYEEKRKYLQDKKAIYRCFCSEQDLEKKRERQIALKLPPRYDRTCLALSDHDVSQKIASKMPFIWRFKLDHSRSLPIHDLAHGTITFALSNFSDFAITRADGSFTFIFANFVDDFLMDITHIFRGEDHLSNTANQAALFDVCGRSTPIYWHIPILCNTEGKKLSKRDFGFSLRDLKSAGFLPEAICNYLAIIGGSFKEEINSNEDLIKIFNFDNVHTTGRITYDVEKLKWVNKNWIVRYDPAHLTALCRPLLEQNYTHAAAIDNTTLTFLLQTLKSEFVTINDCVKATEFYFNPPALTHTDFQACITTPLIPTIHTIVSENMKLLSQPEEFVAAIKKESKNRSIPLKELFWFLRLSMMGHTNGPGIHELITMLGTQEAQKRIEKSLNLLAVIQ